MPNTNPLLRQKEILAFAVEADLGVAESTLAASIKAYDVDLQPVDEPIILPAQGTIGVETVLESAKSTSLSFYNYACGKGSSGVPAWAALFTACGMVLNTATYTIQTATGSFKSMTAAHYLDGWLFAGRGFMGNWTLTAEAGKPWRINWSFLGGFTATPSADTLPSSTAETVGRVAWGATGGLTVGGEAFYRPATVTIDGGAQVSLREDPNAAGGYLGGSIDDIVPTLSMDPEAMAVATRNWYAARAAGTEFDIVLVLNGGTNNTITITCGDCVLQAMPSKGVRGKKAVENLVFVITDGISIAFT